MRSDNKLYFVAATAPWTFGRAVECLNLFKTGVFSGKELDHIRQCSSEN